MNRLCTALLAFLVLLAFSAPAWANGTSHSKLQYKKMNDTRYGHYHPKIEKHKFKVLMQFRALKWVYTKSNEDARQMFLEFLGSSLPSSDTDIQKLRDEYEQQLAQQNATIASQQLQLTRLNQTIASQQQQLTDLNATIQSQQQQMNVLLASQQAALDDLVLQMTQQCDAQVSAAFNDGRAEGLATCSNTGPAGQAQLMNSWSTAPLYPHALDVDGSGNVVVLDDYNMAIVKYDRNGQPTRWDLDTFQQPVDLAVDSQGNMYVLDQEAPDHLQKFGMEGQPVGLNSSSTPMVYPMGLFIDSQDNIYATDMGGAHGGRILVFDSSGNHIRTLGEVPELSNQPYFDIAVDEQNNFIYVVTSSSVAKLDLDGGFVTSWQGNFNSSSSIAAGSQGQVFVANSFNSEIYQYDANGALMYTIGSNEINTPYHIVVGDSGDLYVADYFNRQVKIYR